MARIKEFENLKTRQIVNIKTYDDIFASKRIAYWNSRMLKIPDSQIHIRSTHLMIKMGKADG